MRNQKTNDLFGKIIIFLILYTCFFNAVKTIYPGYVIMLIVITILLCIYLLINHRSKIKVPFIYVIIPLMIAVSELYTISSSATNRYLIIYTLLFIIFCLITQIKNWKKILINYTLFFSLIACIVTIVSFISNTWYLNFLLPNIDAGSRNTMKNLVVYAHSYPGLFASTGVNAFFISTGLSITFVRLLNDSVSEKKRRYYVYIILFLISLFLTLKRATILINGIIMFGMYLIKNKQNFKRIMLLPIIILIFATIMIKFFPVSFNNLMSRFDADSFSELLNGRSDLYNFAKEYISEHPFIGVGYGCFSRAYSLNTGYSGIALDAHNEFLQLFSELGIIQGFCIIICVLKIYFDTIKIYLQTEKTKNNNEISISMYLQSYFILYCMVGNPFHDTTIFLLVTLYAMFYLDRKEEINE